MLDFGAEVIHCTSLQIWFQTEPHSFTFVAGAIEWGLHDMPAYTSNNVRSTLEYTQHNLTNA